jgi:hypothetical protein
MRCGVLVALGLLGACGLPTADDQSGAVVEAGAIARAFSTMGHASGQVIIQLTRGGGPDNPKICGIAVAGS